MCAGPIDRRFVVVVALLALGGAVLPVAGQEIAHAVPPADVNARRQRFEERNSQANIEKLSRRLAAVVDLNTPGVAEGFARLHELGKHAEALDAYRDYVLRKLREPEHSGIPARCVRLEEPASPGCDQGVVRSPADELMRNIFTARSLKVDLGEPGGVNWVFAPKAWRDRPVPAEGLEGSDDHTGDAPYLPRTEAWRKGPSDLARHFRLPKCFNHLLAAYAETGDGKYVEKWAAFIDDWCMNQKADVDGCPYNIHLYVPHHMERFQQFIGNLAVVARRQVMFQDDLPGPTLARLLLRYLPECAAATMRNLRYFESNWRFLASQYLIDVGLLFCEFRFSDTLIREGKRGVENAQVLCELPDGSDYELTPNYWGTYLEWASYPLAQLYRTHRRDWMTKAWYAELRDHTWMRSRAILAHLMPDGRWPIAPPQDMRSQLGEYDRRQIRDVIPEFYDVADNARRPNRAFAGCAPRYRSSVFGNGETDAPTYASEWLPYGGWYFLRGGWEREDHFLFMKSSSHVVGHGGPSTLWSNNNAASLYAFGKELLFLHHITPVTVDGLEQNPRAGLPYCGHMGYMLGKAIHVKPRQARWHDSDAFAFAEGIYDGAYGCPGEHVRARLLGKRPAADVTDVTHIRQIHFVKPLGLWIVTDRLGSEREHAYVQKWHLHIPEESVYGPIHGFTKDEVVVDHDVKSVRTLKRGGPNISFYQIGSASLTMRAKMAPPNPKGVKAWSAEGRNPRYTENENYLFAYTISKIWTTWKGKGNQVLITLAFPRETRDVELRQITPVNDHDGVYGFDAVLPGGGKVAYRVAANKDGTIRLGNVSIRGESVLLADMDDGRQGGIALGCKDLVVDGAARSLETGNVELTLAAGGDCRTVVIHRPIDPVRISPDVNAFADHLDVTMATGTPGVSIYYTLDGSEPTPASPRYTGPVRLTESTTVRARAVRNGVSEVPTTLTGTEATVVSRAVFAKQSLRRADALTGLKQGLRYDYFEAPWQDLMLLLDQCRPIRRGTVGQVPDVSGANRNSHFAFRYIGYFEAPRDGVYTFHAPDPMYDPNQVNLETGYDLQVWVGGELWYPGTRHHGFGTWSIVLSKGLHPIKITYVDYRGGKEDLYFPNREYGCVWGGDKPDLLVSGPELAKEPIAGELLWHRD